MGDRREGHGLEGRSDTKVSDLLHGDAQFIGYDGGYRKSAHPTLAGSHATPQIRLHLVGALPADLHGRSDLAGRYFFAAAHDGFGPAGQGIGGGIENLEEAPSVHLLPKAG